MSRSVPDEKNPSRLSKNEKGCENLTGGNQNPETNSQRQRKRKPKSIEDSMKNTSDLGAAHTATSQKWRRNLQTTEQDSQTTTY
jgi:hypothetical protein